MIAASVDLAPGLQRKVEHHGRTAELARSPGAGPRPGRAVGFATDVHGLGDRNLGEPGVLPQIAREAYRSAGVQDPDRELDVVEVHEASSAHTLLWREGPDCPQRAVRSPAPVACSGLM